MITSPTGAAVHDIVTILAAVAVGGGHIRPVLVQGEGAAPQLIDALKR
ncbi:MAG: exodeoxyribonuclease VII large subunit [Anaeromassilibacillus sp.]